MDGSAVAPSPWSLSFGAGGKPEWVDQGGKGGTSGALATTVTKNWVDKLCQVRRLQ